LWLLLKLELLALWLLLKLELFRDGLRSGSRAKQEALIVPSERVFPVIRLIWSRIELEPWSSRIMANDR
jgi:hypothetical protein